MIKPLKQSNEQRYFDALRRIARHYYSSKKIQETAERKYGLSPREALEMSYDNLQAEAREAIHGRKRPKSKPVADAGDNPDPALRRALLAACGLEEPA